MRIYYEFFQLAGIEAIYEAIQMRVHFGLL